MKYTVTETQEDYSTELAIRKIKLEFHDLCHGMKYEKGAELKDKISKFQNALLFVFNIDNDKYIIMEKHEGVTNSLKSITINSKTYHSIFEFNEVEGWNVFDDTINCLKRLA